MPHFKHLSLIPKGLTPLAQKIQNQIEEIDLENKAWSVSELAAHLGCKSLDGQALDITRAAVEKSQFNYLEKKEEEIAKRAVALYSFAKNSKQRTPYKIAGTIKSVLGMPKQMQPAPQQRLTIIVEEAIQQYKRRTPSLLGKAPRGKEAGS